jgi:hypothetical protein
MAAMTKSVNRRVPGEGERAARRGYVHQDRSSARLLYEAIADRSLCWIGLADRSAGVADDLVLGLADAIVAHQFKRSARPTGIGLTALLLGTGCAIAELAASYLVLRRQFPGLSVRLRYLTNDYPSVNDRLVDGDEASSTAAFLAVRAEQPERTLAEWRTSRWRPLIDRLVSASGLFDVEFERFWLDFELVMGPDAVPALDPGEDKDRQAQIEALARALSALIADHGKDRWSRAELLEAIGWPDRYALRFTHNFPIGAYVQRNEVTEARLAGAIVAHRSGYVSLVGPPGAGKSTLLQRELREQPNLHVVRYLAFVPGTSQGQGRGEADFFYDDVNTQLAATGLKPLRVKDDTTRARQQAFSHLIERAGERYVDNGTRYLIVVDGLDHIPREEHPDRSLLAALPLPQSVPDGVIFVLGTQRLDLDDLPRAVREHAADAKRRIDIAPLSERAVSAMADALGLPPDVPRQKVYQVGGGHPLVTRYLIERLISVDSTTREKVLSGDHGFGGDLEAVYDAAWRGIEQAKQSETVKQVLALLARVQGPIEPQLLARITSDLAIETALREVGHLLERTKLGWSVFHNSFRLYLQGKPVLRFGVPDPAFASAALYRTLAALTKHASRTSPQRWLAFRYLYLAGAHDEALALAGRAYFVQQYCEGRSAHDVRGDISDAFRSLKGRCDSVKLFDLMIAGDEVERRATVMEGATSLIDAYLAAGDVEAARAALSDAHEEGKQWLVIDALLETGEIEPARQLFEGENPFRALSDNAIWDSGAEAALAWAERAVLFLDDAQLDRYVSESLGDGTANHGKLGQSRADLLGTVKFQIARALARADHENLARVSERWSVNAEDFPVLLLEGAEAALAASKPQRARSLLEQASVHAALGGLHASWPLSAARLALRMGAHDLARQFVAHTPLEGLRAIEAGYRSERLVPVCRALVTGIVVRAALGIALPALDAPEDRLLKGVQHHLVALGAAIGAARAGTPISTGEIGPLTSAAIHFLATARIGRDEDWFTSYLVPRAADVIGDALFNLLDLSGSDGVDTADLADALIAGDTALFRWWPSFRRLVALRTFDLNGDRDAALARLEAGLADVSASDPREEIEEKTAYAAAIAQIGATERARAILADLRDSALGVYLPAKKDGQYELWVGMLAHANVADPEGRAPRAETALRLLVGLEQTEGSDMGRRISRQILFEAAAADPTTAWSAAKAMSGTGAISWDGVVDATLRGIILRNPRLADAALIAWSCLCLPWYAEPHASTTATGQFLKDLIASAQLARVAELEAAAAAAIDALAQPDMKSVLLRMLEEAAKDRGGGDCAHAAAARWENQRAPSDDIDPDHRSYGHLIDLPSIADALTSELAFRDERDGGRGADVPIRKISYDLRRAASRVIANSNWMEARDFAEAQPMLAAESEIAMAFARVAAKAGAVDAARDILAPLIDPDAEGWSWPSERGRVRYHEIRHLLAEPDAFEAARADFIDDMAGSRYGVTTTLWATEAIFPLLFETVPWPDLWNRLEEQIRASRDYRLGQPVPAIERVGDDAELLVKLFTWALELGVPLMHAEAARGATTLLRRGYEAIFVAIVERLISTGGEATMLGMDLLSGAVDHRALPEAFSNRLPALAEDPDIGVAAAASFLAERWGVEVGFKPRDLPAFYQLHLPPQDRVLGDTASDAHTRGMVIEDPLGWTQGWESLVRRIAENAELPPLQIRWRVRQLILSWGGIPEFGHPGSKRLETALNRLDLKLPYRRPQSEAVLRALRYVAGELWSAGRLSYRDWRYILLKLHVDPDKAIMPFPEARPPDVHLPTVPQMLWGKEQEAWLEGVSGDLALTSGKNKCKVVAEWRRSVIREIRVTTTAEQWCAVGQLASALGNLDAVLESLPEVIRLGSPVPLYDADEINPSKTALFEPHALQSEPSGLLIFCPRTAAMLGWASDPKIAHVYRDAEGKEMVRTLWWRDGVPQSIDKDARFAEGQRILLSEVGQSAFEAMFGPFRLTTSAWRRVETAKGDGTPGERFTTDAGETAV